MHYRAPSVSPLTCSQGMKGWSREWSMSSSAGMQARLRALRCLQILSTGADNIKRLLRQELLIWLPEFTTLFLKSASLGNPRPSPIVAWIYASNQNITQNLNLSEDGFVWTSSSHSPHPSMKMHGCLQARTTIIPLSPKILLLEGWNQG